MTQTLPDWFWIGLLGVMWAIAGYALVVLVEFVAWEIGEVPRRAPR